MGEPGKETRRILYGRRRGRRLRVGQQRLLDELLPSIRIDLPTPPGQLDPRGLFDEDIEGLWLEIGFGAGEHLAAQARTAPTIGMLGCEPYVNGVASLLSRIHRDGIHNIRIHPGDARGLLDVLADRSIRRAFILFPDPWPKSRHARRRLVGGATLDSLARVMDDGAELRLASDVPEHVRWMLRQLLAHRDFAWLARRPTDWRERTADWPQTRYERKGLAAGRCPTYLRFCRCPRATASARVRDKPLAHQGGMV